MRDAARPRLPLVRSLWLRLDGCQPQTVFLLVAGVFGLACAAVTPPVQVPDEPAHLLRIDQLAQGRWLSDRRPGPGGFEYGGTEPLSLYEFTRPFARLSGHERERLAPAETFREYQRPLDPGRTAYLQFPNTALYSPVPYVPAAAAVAVARLWRPPPVVLMDAARVGTLVGFLGVGWLAIRTTPVLKWPAVLALCCPMSLFLAGGATADPMTTAVAFLFAAVALRAAVATGPLTARTAAALTATAVALALCKSAYAPLTLLGCAARPGRWTRRAYPFVAPVAAVATVVAWSAVSHPQQVREAGGDPAAQLAWVEHHPVAFASVLARTLPALAGDLTAECVGVLGWLDTFLPLPFVGTFLGVLAWLTVAYGEPVAVGLAPRILAIVAIACSVALVALANYMVWTPTAAPQIAGLQGRYFLPLVLTGGVVLHRRDGYPVRPAWMAVLLAGIGSVTVWTVACRYYSRAG